MLNNKAVRRLLNATGFMLAVPTVVTCGGHLIPADETGGASSAGGSESTLGTGGGPILGAGGDSMPGAGGSYTGNGGSSPATGGANVTSTWEAKVFLGKYAEPVNDANYRVPAPPATAWVTRPCNERTEVCSGGPSREDWAKNIITQCMAETGSGGCIDFIFDRGDTCSKYVVVWHGASSEMGRCVSTVAYYESCTAQMNDAGALDVVRYGADCSPL